MDCVRKAVEERRNWNKEKQPRNESTPGKNLQLRNKQMEILSHKWGAVEERRNWNKKTASERKHPRKEFTAA